MIDLIVRSDRLRITINHCFDGNADGETCRGSVKIDSGLLLAQVLNYEKIDYRNPAFE